jgi:hypothetical protein
MTDPNIRNLACAICLRAARDYFSNTITPKDQKKILHELRSEWMRFITEGTSVVIAEQLEKNPEAIRERIKHMPKEA